MLANKVKNGMFVHVKQTLLLLSFSSIHLFNLVNIAYTLNTDAQLFVLHKDTPNYIVN